MKTPEEIKKVLRECDEGYACKRIECPYDDGLCLCNGSRCMLDTRKDALAYIQQLEAQVPRWISVKDRLPENLDNVLICDDRGGVVVGHYDEDDGHFWKRVNDNTFHSVNAAYWMPLPERPKEG